MTGNPWLDWVILTVSLFNTILLVWLGLTVLLNADRRSPGVWLGGGGLLLGALFFVSHSILVAQPLVPLPAPADFWWHAAWGPIILNPLSWYLVVLWYAGYWDDPLSALRRRQMRGLAMSIFLALLLAGLAVYGNPLPRIYGVNAFAFEKVLSLGGVPVLVLIFPVYIILCIALALDALLRPGPTARFMGQQARQRARPWLVGASLTLLSVSLIVGGVVIWLYRTLLAHPTFTAISGPILFTLAWFDLLIAALIAVAILLIGQSVVAYEIFTGNALPRRGFLRQWQNAVILAAYVSAIVAATLSFALRPVYALLLTTLLMTVFYALFSGRIYAERNQVMASLRSFVSGQRLYDQALDSARPLEDAGGEQALAALCRDLLETGRACLIAVGPLAPLAGAPLTYPPGADYPLPSPGELSARITSVHEVALPLEAGIFSWAVPLWSERGLVGWLLLGPKREGSFYTEEEIAIARAAGERLVDQRAAAALTRRLVELQRRSLVETQLLDRQTRRVLHDDVLPLLHAALLRLPSQQQGDPLVDALTQAHHKISDLLRDVLPAGDADLARLGLAGALRRLAEEEYAASFDRVQWLAAEDAVLTARRLPDLPAQAAYFAAREAIRNAARHGQRLPGQDLCLSVSLQRGEDLRILIEDNGGGVQTALPAAGGTGQGLALHSALLAVAGGALSLESVPGRSTRVILSIPFPRDIIEPFVDPNFEP